MAHATDEAARSLSPWIRMREQFPEPYARVIFFDAVAGLVRVGVWQDGLFQLDGPSMVGGWGCVPQAHVTHWQPVDVPELTADEQDQLHGLWYTAGSE